MTNKRPKPEEIVSKLRQVEILIGQGMLRIDTIPKIAVTKQTYHRWRKKYGGTGIEKFSAIFLLQDYLWRA